eukprot:1151633-Pelagomonas_calceolata.AAC.5
MAWAIFVLAVKLMDVCTRHHQQTCTIHTITKEGNEKRKTIHARSGSLRRKGSPTSKLVSPSPLAIMEGNVQDAGVYHTH